MIESIVEWFKRAKPTPTYADFQVQLGCHFEEIVEQLDEMQVTDINHKLMVSQAADCLERVAQLLKSKDMIVRFHEDEAFLKELCDSVVTAVGVAYSRGYNITEAMQRVDESNWSKFDENGLPILDKQGKVSKGPHYKQADMGGLV